MRTRANKLLRVGDTWRIGNIGLRLVSLNVIHLPATANIEILGRVFNNVPPRQDIPGSQFGLTNDYLVRLLNIYPTSMGADIEVVYDNAVQPGDPGGTPGTPAEETKKTLIYLVVAAVIAYLLFRKR